MKKIPILFSLVFLMFCSAIGQTWTISGTVTSSNTQQPIANHQVNIFRVDSMTSTYYSMNTMTNASGQYSFTNVPATNGFPPYSISTSDCQNQSQYQSASTNNAIVNFSICTAISCQANFTAYPDSLNANQIHFYNQSTGNPTSYSWSFGDGTSSSLQHPTHTYSSAGNYTVTLAISGPGCQNSTSQTITIGNPSPCNASFTHSATISNPLAIHFTNTSTGGNPATTSYQWFFNDGTGSTSTFTNPIYTFPQSGSYNVVLIMNSGSCIDSISMTVQVQSVQPCNSNFIIYPDSTNPNTYYFNDQSTGNPTSWSWDFGDGTTSTLQYPIHTYSSNGTFTVTLTISGGSCQGTTMTSTQTLTVTGGSNPTFSLQGTIYASNATVGNAHVSVYDATNGLLVLTVQANASGAYTFPSLNIGTYYIAALPDSASSFINTHVQTYFGDVINWFSATTIQLIQNEIGKNINLQAISIVPGNGVVSGNIGAGPKGGVPNLLVHLLNTNNEVVANAMTDVNGNYSFNNIGNGNFAITVELLSYTTTPIQVSLSPTSVNSSGNNFVISGNTIIPVVSNINNESQLQIGMVYPNPVTDILNIEFTNEQSQYVSVSIYSLTGQMLIQESHTMQNNSSTQINISELLQGSYLLVITSANGNSTQKLISKM